MTTPERVRILDGGLGTSLEDRYGVVFDDATPLWSSHLIVSDPDTLLACQRDFVEAGADVLLTPTYQVSIEGFARTKVAPFPDGIPRFAIERYLANAPGLEPGPLWACMLPSQEYSGKYDDDHDTEEALYRWHLERLRLFTNVQGLMDRIAYVAFETLPRLDEIRAVRRAYHDADMGKEFWISCVFPGEANLLPDGTPVDHAVKGMLEPLSGGSKPWGIGINCTKLNKLPSLIKSYGESVRSMTSAPTLETAPCLLLYPDGTKGEVYNTTTKKWEKQQAHTQAADHKDQGVFRSFIVGGCCKASAAEINELRWEFPGSSRT
ncbi:hypothetical protein PG994_014621 [Apiospora phragmitis]|uniref:Hcy-binding domain-containing protein n=1 Tax=Apiospora phragmitis TaxID=2905665 RepID=A0ABR1T6Y5_9PEZI